MELRKAFNSVCVIFLLAGCTATQQRTTAQPVVAKPPVQQTETATQPETQPDSDGFTEMTLPEQPISKGILQTAELESIYDGDTIRVRLKCSEPLFCSSLPVRVAGIDTPELKTKDACEKQAAQRAKAYATSFLKAGKLELRNCSRGKYFRLVCDVYSNGQSLANALIQRGLAYPYDGGTKTKRNYCK